MGNPYIPANTALAYARETTYGVRSAAATPGTYAYATATQSAGSGLQNLGKFSADVTFPDAHIDVKGLRSFGVGRQWKRRQAGAITREGSLPLYPERGELLGYVFGHELFTAGSPNLHLLAPVLPGGTAGAPDFNSLVSGGRSIFPAMDLVALMRNDAAAGARHFQRTFLGTVCEEASVTIEKEEPLKMDVGILSNGIRDQNLHMDSGITARTPIAPSFNGFTDTAGRPYMFYDSQITVAPLSGDTVNRPVARIQKASIGLKNNMKTQRYLVDGAGQEPFEFLAGMPDFSFDIDMVPAGNLATDLGPTASSLYSAAQMVADSTQTRESFYDLLDSQIYVNTATKVAKSGLTGAAEDSIRFDFKDALLSEGDLKWSIDGEPIMANVVVEPRTLFVTVKDNIAQYVV